MSKQLVPVLADAMRAYYTGEELGELCALFDDQVEWDHARNEPAYISIAKRLITETERSNNGRTLSALLPSLFSRCSEQISKTSWERREFHQEMQTRLEELRPLLGTSAVHSEIAVSDGRPFTAKSAIRDLVGKAEGSVLLVDPYIGVSTLDCFREVTHALRILTGQQKQSIEQGFDTALKEFRSEGRIIDVRRHQKLHDRYLLFNDRCWLVGGSIKDAGKKALNVIECLDSKQVITRDAEQKWTEATVHP